MGDDCSTLKYRPSAGTMAALGLRSIKADALPTTAYIMLGEKCVRDCSFCAQAQGSSAGAGRLSRVTWPEADEKDLMSALARATESGSIRRVCLQTVGGRGALSDVCRAVSMIRSSCAAGTGLSVSFSATAGIADVGAIIAAGADRVALAIDACSPELHRKIKKADMGASMSLISKASSEYPGKISTHLIAGMGETERQLLELAADLRDMGVGLGLFAFTPLRGTAMEKHSKPDLGSYRRVQLAFYMLKHHGLSKDRMGFDADGKLASLGMSKETIIELVGRGEAFLTSGCKWCNRPYYNESPGTELYNYPRELSGTEAKRALALSIEGLKLSGVSAIEGGGECKTGG